MANKFTPVSITSNRPSWQTPGIIPNEEVNFKPYSIIQNVIKNYLPTSLVEKGIDRLKIAENNKTYQNSSLKYPLETFGNNLIASPDMYLNAPTKDVTTGALPYDIGGQTSLTKGVIINSDINSFNPIGSLIHEIKHYSDMFNPINTLDFSAFINKKELMTKQKELNAKVKSSFKSVVDNGATDPIFREAISGQLENDEIVAQLKNYEAFLPAGMTLFQSPLGKKLFKDNDSKLWWLMNTQKSMSYPSFENKNK